MLINEDLVHIIGEQEIKLEHLNRENARLKRAITARAGPSHNESNYEVLGQKKHNAE